MFAGHSPSVGVENSLGTHHKQTNYTRIQNNLIITSKLPPDLVGGTKPKAFKIFFKKPRSQIWPWPFVRDPRKNAKMGGDAGPIKLNGSTPPATHA